MGTTWVRKDLLDKMGMDIPTNPDEFHEMLLAAKSEYPELASFAFQGAEFAHVDTVVLGAFVKEEVTDEIVFGSPSCWWTARRNAAVSQYPL